MQGSLFNTETFQIEDGFLSFTPSIFAIEEAKLFFEELLNKTEWRSDTITLFGKAYKQPRLTALYGFKVYSYSNITMQPLPFTPTLLKIKKHIERITGEEFNVCLLNLYRDGNDSNGWHADNEKSLGKNPTIASVSFGDTRMFHLKHNNNGEKIKLALTHNSLLVMKGETQHFWKHQIPKTKKSVGPRINLTFRYIK